jgi:hypothetical protein
MPVRLHPLEDLLRVVQDGGSRVHQDRAVRNDLAVMPADALGPGDRHHVVGEVLAEPGGSEDLGPAFDRNRRRILGDAEVELGGACLDGAFTGGHRDTP